MPARGFAARSRLARPADRAGGADLDMLAVQLTSALDGPLLLYLSAPDLTATSHAAERIADSWAVTDGPRAPGRVPRRAPRGRVLKDRRRERQPGPRPSPRRTRSTAPLASAACPRRVRAWNYRPTCSPAASRRSRSRVLKNLNTVGDQLIQAPVEGHVPAARSAQILLGPLDGGPGCHPTVWHGRCLGGDRTGRRAIVAIAECYLLNVRRRSVARAARGRDSDGNAAVPVAVHRSRRL